MFSIVTTEANGLMAKVHNVKKRMPTILDKDLAYEWIFGQLDEKRITEIGLSQYPSEEIEAYPVDKDYRNALDPTAPFYYPDLPGLDESDGLEKEETVQTSLF